MWGVSFVVFVVSQWITAATSPTEPMKSVVKRPKVTSKRFENGILRGVVWGKRGRGGGGEGEREGRGRETREEARRASSMAAEGYLLFGSSWRAVQDGA